MRTRWHRIFLLTIPGDDKIRILLHNAQQILEVLRKTFAGAAFDRQTYPGTCVESNSDIEMLSCQWTNITRMLERGDSEGTETILKALLEVRFAGITEF